MTTYALQHITRFRYATAISESVMEVWMQPRTEAWQHLLRFTLAVNPRARVMSYRDPLGNTVHHFDIPAQHTRLTITADAVVEMFAPPPIPDALDASAWAALDALTGRGDLWDMLHPSHFARPTDKLAAFAAELDVRRRDDPLTLARQLNTALHDAFGYDTERTDADSPIDLALDCRCGVCQDYAHIMIALLRGVGIPARYVSGYLFHNESHRSAANATHAWVEAFLPHLGWVGFDPTNNILAGEQHIRAAIGRDYADVPPTRGVFKGVTESVLSVAVSVSQLTTPPASEPAPLYDQASVEALGATRAHMTMTAEIGAVVNGDVPDSDESQQQAQQQQ